MDNFDASLLSLFSWNFLLFGLGIALIIYILRTIVEYFASIKNINLNNNKLYRELILPIAPILIGVFFAHHLKMYPFPDILVSQSSKDFWGSLAGASSGLLYRIAMGMLNVKIAQETMQISNPTYNPITYSPVTYNSPITYSPISSVNTITPIQQTNIIQTGVQTVSPQQISQIPGPPENKMP